MKMGNDKQKTTIQTDGTEGTEGTEGKGEGKTGQKCALFNFKRTVAIYNFKI